MTETARICPPIYRRKEAFLNCKFCGPRNTDHAECCPTRFKNPREREAKEREFLRGFEDGLKNLILPNKDCTFTYLLGFGKGLSKRQEKYGDDSLYIPSCEEVKGI